MVGLSTQSFRSALNQLCRKPKHKYGSCPADVCSELEGKTIETLAQNNVCLHDNGIRCVLKIRVANEGRNIGQSSGFRLIAVGDRETQELTLLFVYPKTGALGISDITDKYLADLLSDYFDERDKGILVKVDLKNKLTEIVELPIES